MEALQVILITSAAVMGLLGIIWRKDTWTNLFVKMTLFALALANIYQVFKL